MVLNIIYFGYKFDLKFRVLNWFWTWTEPTEPVLLGSVQVWIQVWTDDSRFRFRFRLRGPWTELNWTSTALGHANFDLLLGWPFHCLMSTTTEDSPDGAQLITLRNPNTGSSMPYLPAHGLKAALVATISCIAVTINPLLRWVFRTQWST